MVRNSHWPAPAGAANLRQGSARCDWSDRRGIDAGCSPSARSQAGNYLVRVVDEELGLPNLPNHVGYALGW